MKLLKRIFRRRGYSPATVYRYRWHTLAVLCLSLVVVMIGNTSLNVAIPILARDLSATNTQLQWMVDAYSLVFTGLLFVAGSIGDRYGRKGMLQSGMVLFGLSSLYAGLFVNDSNTLIITRIFMGIAGAMIMPATLSILTNVFSAKERPKAVGIWAGMSGGGVALGPLLSGYMLEHFSWQSVFLINVPVILIALVLGAVLIPRSSDREHTNLDLVGAGLSVVGLSSVIYALVEAPNRGWLSLATIGFSLFGLVVMAVFVWWENKIEKPMLDVSLFKVPAFGISSLVLTLVFFALMGLFFNMSQLFQLVFEYSPLEAAIRMLPIAAVMVVFAPMAPFLVDKFGKRKIVSAGVFIIALGIFMMSGIGVDSSYTALVVSMGVASAGMAIAMSPTTDLLMSAVPKNRAGMGSAMNDTTRELGASLGVAILGSLLASEYTGRIQSFIATVPEMMRESIEHSLAGALSVGQQIGGESGSSIILASKEAWLQGFQYSLIVGAIILAAASVIVFLFLPDKSVDL